MESSERGGRSPALLSGQLQLRGAVGELNSHGSHHLSSSGKRKVSGFNQDYWKVVEISEGENLEQESLVLCVHSRKVCS